MTIIDAIILGVVEGITEFLPISSTGHLIIVGDLLLGSVDLFTKSFDIIIQFGAILAVVVIFWERLFDLELWKKLLVAFIPTAIVGLIMYKLVKTYFLGNVEIVLWALFIGGIALILFEFFYKKRGDKESTHIDVKEIGYKKAFIIGLFQSIAIIPGVSRSAATIIGGLAFGLSRQTVVEFSFLLAIPTMFVASGFDFVKNFSVFSSENIGVLVTGFVVSFIVSFISIKFLLKYIQKHDFIPFGVYRILLAIVLFVWVV